MRFDIDRVFKWAAGIVVVGCLLVVMLTVQMRDYQRDMESEAEHAELLYLRAWKKAHNDSIRIEEQRDQCIQDAFRMLKPFLRIPMEPPPPKPESRGIIT